MKERTQKFLFKASGAIRAAELLLNDEPEFAVGRAYYALFYIAVALLAERDLSFRKHGGVHAAFAEHFIKSGLLDAKYHRWLLDAFDQRLQGDYGVDATVTADDAEHIIERAKQFLRASEVYLGKEA
ncbi:MAG: HEPN domain-containing protein [Acidobacteria bacterium]|jgi:uncharacterized protein (UPF0332 family)|nr:HEPN domain-containing protein [Acidobacteriota bacterium]